MVYKIEKYGARTGNTFRVRNRRFMQRYKRGAYIFRTHSGEHPDAAFDKKGLLNEDRGMTDNIQYSLNKQRRWELPEIIEGLILDGEHEDQYSFQLVQRHRIFKNANCISVSATDGVFRGGRITKDRLFKIKNSGGFFQSNSVLKGKASQSRRQMREQRRLRQQQRLQQEGGINEIEQVREAPQIRYEVHFPTPETSFLAHSPKAVGMDTRKPYVYSGCQDKHKKQKKRTRLFHAIKESSQDIEEFTDDELEDIFEQFCEDKTKQDSYKLTLEELIHHANTARDLLVGRKRRHSSLTSDSSDETKPLTKDPKMHIILLEKEDNESYNAQSSQSLKQMQISRVPRCHLEMQPVYVILQNEETTPQRLAEVYGSEYVEASCFSRKFLINISDRALKEKYRYLCAFLIFIFDVDSEMNNMKESVFKVLLNAHFGSEIRSVKVETVFDYTETNIDELINRAQFYFETLPEEALVCESSSGGTARQRQSYVEKCANWSTKSYHANSAFLIEHLLNQREPDNLLANCLDFEIISHPNIGASDMPDVASPGGQFCAICFEELGEQSGTALMSCSHWFCDNCWKEYLYTQIDRGDIKLQCPEYGCKQFVDAGTLLSLAGIRDVLQFVKHHHDNQVQMQTVRKWCPNKRCGRAVQVNLESVGFAQCVCGEKFCMKCMGKSHWPASCDVVQTYTNKLRKTGDIALLPEELTMACTVHGKNCPKCNRFVEKNGGCPYMYCICGSAFCWGCGKLWDSRTHNSQCYKNGYNNKHGTQPFLIQQDRIEDKKREKWYKKAVRHRLNQHPSRASKLKSMQKDLAIKLQHYMVKSRHKGVDVKIDFTVQGKEYKSEADKIHDWLKNTVDMYLEVNYILENTSLLLGLAQLPSENRPRLQYINNRLAYFAEDINSLLKNGTALMPAVEVLTQLTEVRAHTEQSIRSLIRVIKQLDL